MELNNRHTVLIGAATAALAAAAVVGVSAAAEPAPSHGIVVEAHMGMLTTAPEGLVVPDHMALLGTTDGLVVPDHGYVA